MWLWNGIRNISNAFVTDEDKLKISSEQSSLKKEKKISPADFFFRYTRNE